MPITKLALSGGGFRATLFHLGVVRYLCESGDLGNVKDIVSVSGGSILAAHMALNWDDYTNHNPETFGRAVGQLIEFVQSDLRGRVFRTWLFVRCFPIFVVPILAGLAAWNFPAWQLWIWAAATFVFVLGILALLRGWWSRAALLQHGYRTGLLKKAAPAPRTSFLKRFVGLLRAKKSFKLRDLQAGATAHRTFVLAATNLTTGEMCAFRHDGFHWVRLVGNVGGSPVRVAEPFPQPHLPLELAVAASSAFPPGFPPIRLKSRLVAAGNNVALQSDQFLTDGGVHENLGIEAVDTWAPLGNDDVVVVSDAERPFGWVLQEWTRFRSTLTRATRVGDIVMRRVSEFEKAGRDGDPRWKFVRLQDSAPGFTEPIQDHVRKIRTDLDNFSDLEIQCLVYQGYAAAHHLLAREGNDVVPPGIEFASDVPRVRQDHQHSCWLPFSDLTARPDQDLERSKHVPILRSLFGLQILSPLSMILLVVLALAGSGWNWYRNRPAPLARPARLAFHVESLDETLARQQRQGPVKDFFQAIGTGMKNPQHFWATTLPVSQLTDGRGCPAFQFTIPRNGVKAKYQPIAYLLRVTPTDAGEALEYLGTADLKSQASQSFAVPASASRSYFVLVGCVDLDGALNRDELKNDFTAEASDAK